MSTEILFHLRNACEQRKWWCFTTPHVRKPDLKNPQTLVETTLQAGHLWLAIVVLSDSSIGFLSLVHLNLPMLAWENQSQVRMVRQVGEICNVEVTLCAECI